MPKNRRQFMSAAAGLAALGWIGPERLSAAEPERGWIKSPHNPMLSLGGPQEFDCQNIMSPSIVKDGGKYYLFYAGGPAGPLTKEDYVRYQLGLALSDDGLKWTKRGQPLLPLAARDNFHTTPALLREPGGQLHKPDGLWHLVYCGNRADDLEHATSRDGLTWDKDPRNPIYRAAYSPTILQVGEELWLYYIHKPPDGKSWEVHLARGRDIGSLSAHPTNPVLKRSQAWEGRHLFYPYVLREGQTWIMFYAAYWQGHPNSTVIGMATSTDGVQWTKSEANPVLTPTPGSKFDATYTSAQSVLPDGDHYKLYYGARINQVHKYYAIGLATWQGRLLAP